MSTISTRNLKSRNFGWPSNDHQALRKCYPQLSGIAMQETLFFPRWEEKKSRKMLFYLRFHSLFSVLWFYFGKCTGSGRPKRESHLRGSWEGMAGRIRGVEWGGL